MSLEILATHGTFVLAGPLVDQVVDRVLDSFVSVDSNITILPAPYHITLLSKAEFQGLAKGQSANLPSTIDTDHVFAAGMGSSPGKGMFIVIIWAAGQQFRKQLSLPPRQFQIVLSGITGTEDDADMGIGSLLPGQFPASPSPDFLDHLVFTLHISKDYEREKPYCVDLILALPDSHRGFLRLADAALSTEQHKLGMLSYACAFERSADKKVQNYSIRKMVECSKDTEWGSILLESEIAKLPGAIRPLLLAPWSTELRLLVNSVDIVPRLCLEPREHLFLPVNLPSTSGPTFQKLPRFFRWLVPFYLAVMSTPR